MNRHQPPTPLSSPRLPHGNTEPAKPNTSGLILRRFERTHGAGSLARLRHLLQNTSATYAEIGADYGITRQRVGQYASLFNIEGRKRERERLNNRPPPVDNKKQPYPSNVRRVLEELQHQGLEVKPYLTTVTNPRPVAHKHLTIVWVNGMACKIGFMRAMPNARFVCFKVNRATRRAEFAILGVESAHKARFYVIPISELEGLTCVNLLATGVYRRTTNKPRRDWSQFLNAWQLLAKSTQKDRNNAARRNPASTIRRSATSPAFRA